MENWEDYKKIYQSIQTPQDTLDIQWENIQHRLPNQQKHPPVYYFRYAGLIAGVVLLLCSGIVFASQKAQPGEALYSVKQLTNSLGFTKTTKPDTKIEKKQTPLIKKPTPTVTPTSVPETPASSAKIEQDVQGAHIENIQQENSHSSFNNGVKQQNTSPSNAGSNGNGSNSQSNNVNQGNSNNNEGKSEESHGNSDTAHGNSGNNSNSNSGNGSGKKK